MKLLVVSSSLDLRQAYSATPSWWQLLKALAERGVDLIVTPYQGPAVETPWWRSLPNPCELEGDFVAFAKRVANDVFALPASDTLVRALVDHVTKPRWQRHLANALARERDVDAILFLTVPPNHFVGVPRFLRERFGVPTYFYDGDLPASLPSFGGFPSGFRIYPGADLSEYEGFFSNSRGGIADLERMGARNVRPLYYAADPSLFQPQDVPQDVDVFFYGNGREYREEWVDAMLARPSRDLPDVHFAARGSHLGDLGRCELLPYLSFSKLREYACRSRVNLLITRQAHAGVYGSSTARPFELAALGCAMVSNPYLGIEEWFEPGREVLVVHDAAEAADTYRRLLRDPVTRRELGARARARFLAEQTYDRRAAQLLPALSGASARPTPELALAL